MRFVEKVAVITGAGGGLGAFYASELSREGASVVAVDMNDTGIKETAAAINNAGGRCLPVAADLTDQEQVERMTAEVINTFGRIDILINNAGGGSSSPGNAGSIEEEDSKSWDLLVDSNLKTTFLCIRAVSKHMKLHSYGKIVNVSSRSARITDPNVHQSPAYATAKTGVLGLTRFAARELGPFGITVNCLVPSLVLSGPVLQEYWDRTPDDAKERYLLNVALRRLPDMKELASVVLFLCSDESSCITGVALDANCGSFMP